MRDEVHLQETGAGIVPIRERPDGNLRLGLVVRFRFLRRPAVSRIGLSKRSGRRAIGEQMLMYQRVLSAR